MIITSDVAAMSNVFGSHSVRAAYWDAHFNLVNPITVLPLPVRSRGISIAFLLCAELFLLGPPTNPASLEERVGMDLLQGRNRKLPKVK